MSSRKHFIQVHSKQFLTEEDLGLGAAIKEPWAKSYAHLWQDGQADFLSEQLYNTVMARSAPHCSVCALLRPSPVSIG